MPPARETVPDTAFLPFSETDANCRKVVSGTALLDVGASLWFASYSNFSRSSPARCITIVAN